MTILSTHPRTTHLAARRWLIRNAEAEISRLARISADWTPAEVTRTLGFQRMADLATYWGDDDPAAPASLTESAEVISTVLADIVSGPLREEYAA
ncbi:hypothetical protein [Nocardioides sp. KR10-350]|uniref:hypothetical protein n=1 Tax=Nocardioides cheoyonin TaxID=3156615 RepID=UPI0032B317C8